MKTLIYILIIFSFFLTACNRTEKVVTENSSLFGISSEAVKDGELLAAFKCEQKINGIEKSIPLKWANVPENTKSLAIIMKHYPNPDDLARPNSYLILWGIDPSVTEIPYGKAGDGPWFMGPNKDKEYLSYTSPCSPSKGSHEYSITIYALSETPASLPKSSSKIVDYDTLINAIATVKVIDTAVLTFNNITL